MTKSQKPSETFDDATPTTFPNTRESSGPGNRTYRGPPIVIDDDVSPPLPPLRSVEDVRDMLRSIRKRHADIELSMTSITAQLRDINEQLGEMRHWTAHLLQALKHRAHG